MNILYIYRILLSLLYTVFYAQKKQKHCWWLILYFVALKYKNNDCILFFFFLRATFAAYGKSQARGRKGAAAPAYTTATATAKWDPSHVCDLHQQPLEAPNP